MRKTFITLLIFGLLTASCSALSPAPTPTPIPPTPMPDPCAKENILAEAEGIQMTVNQFREVAELANSTDVNFLFIPILRLQELRYDVVTAKVPACLENFKNASIGYTASVVNYLMVFMNVQDPNSEDLKNTITTSQNQWQIVMNEFNNLMAIAGVEIPAAPEVVVEPTATAAPVTATNSSGSTVNVRATPQLDAEILTTLEKDATAEATGRNETGDWVQVKVGDATGWVFAETVTLSAAVDQLPVVAVAE